MAIYILELIFISIYIYQIDYLRVRFALQAG